MKPILAVTWRAQAARPGWELLGLEWGLQLLSEMVPGAGSLALLCADPGLFPIRGSGKIPLRLLSKQKGSLGKPLLDPHLCLRRVRGAASCFISLSAGQGKDCWEYFASPSGILLRFLPFSPGLLCPKGFC